MSEVLLNVVAVSNKSYCANLAPFDKGSTGLLFHIHS